MAAEPSPLAPELRIHYVGPYPPTKGGIAQHGRQVVHALCELGHTVPVSSWASQYPTWAYPGAAQTEDAPGTVDDNGTDRTLRWWSPRSWYRVGREAAAADLLVIPWVTPLQVFAYGVVTLVSHVPLVVIAHNPVPHERHALDRPLSRWFLARARGAVVHGEGVAARTDELVPGLPVLSVPHPPNLDLRPSPLPPGPPYRLLCLGYVRPYKGPDIAIAVLAELISRGVDATLTIAGEAWLPEEELRDVAIRHGIEDRVDLLLDYQDETAVQRLLDDHHLLLATYRSATGSGVVPLAHAAGRPAVATPVGGLPDAVQHGRGGLVATSVDPAEVADSVEGCIADLDALARSAAEATGTWQDVALAIIRLSKGS